MKVLVIVLTVLGSIPALAEVPVLGPPSWTPAFDLRPELDDARRLRKTGIGLVVGGAALGIVSITLGMVYFLEGVSTLGCAIGDSFGGLQQPCTSPTTNLESAAIGLAVPSVVMIATGSTLIIVGSRRAKRLTLPTVKPLGGHGHVDGATVSLGVTF